VSVFASRIADKNGIFFSSVWAVEYDFYFQKVLICRESIKISILNGDMEILIYYRKLLLLNFTNMLILLVKHEDAIMPFLIIYVLFNKKNQKNINIYMINRSIINRNYFKSWFLECYCSFRLISRFSFHSYVWQWTIILSNVVKI